MLISPDPLAGARCLMPIMALICTLSLSHVKPEFASNLVALDDATGQLA